MATAEEFFGISRPNLRKDLEEFYDEAEAAIARHRPSLGRELKYRSSLPLSALPFKERAALMAKFRNVIGLDEALNSLGAAPIGSAPVLPEMMFPEGVPSSRISSLNKSIAGIYSRLSTPKAATDASPYGRMPFTSGSFLSDVYSGLNLQFRNRAMADRAGLSMAEGGRITNLTPASFFTTGLESIPSRNNMLREAAEPKNLRNASRLIFDIETAGFGFGSIREVAYTSINASGQKSSTRLAFTPSEFNRGRIYYDDRAMNLTDFLRERYDLKAPVSSTGDDFARGMIPFLEALRDTDYIVGHNIAGFDMEQVFTGLSRTKMYRRDKSFRSLVDGAFESSQSKVVDTLTLARQMPGIQGLKTASELAIRNNGSQFSIANLLLETDLVDYIGLDNLKSMMGYDPARGAFKIGLHHAEVDVAVTDAIIKAADAGGLKQRRLGKGWSDTSFRKALRNSIASSSALTPHTNLTEISQLDPRVLSKLVETYNNKGALRASGELDKLLKGSSQDKRKALRLMRKGELTPDSIRLSALEQEILMTRDIGKGVSQMDTSMGRIPTQIGATKRGARAGLAFGGLSAEERGLAFGISQATSNLSVLGSRERNIAGLAEDTLIGRFETFRPGKMQYLTRTGRASIPTQLLSEAGINLNYVSLSMVESTADTPQGAVNVVKNLTDNEMKKLRRFLDPTKGILSDDAKLSKALGFDSVEAAGDELAKFREAVDGGLLSRIREKGVSVAQLYDGNDPGSTQKIGSLFRSFFNVDGQLTDRDMGKILLPVMDTNDEGILRTAGAVLDKGISEGDISSVGRAVQGSRETYAAYQAMQDDKTMMLMSKAIKRGADAEKAQKVYTFAKTGIIDNLGKGALGLAAVGIGAVLFNRKQDMDRLDQTMDFQGYESSAEGQYAIYDQIQARIASGYDGAANTYDPLLTASVTNNLNSLKQGHSVYSWDRSNMLYGGIL